MSRASANPFAQRGRAQPTRSDPLGVRPAEVRFVGDSALQAWFRGRELLPPANWYQGGPGWIDHELIEAYRCGRASAIARVYLGTHLILGIARRRQRSPFTHA